MSLLRRRLDDDSKTLDIIDKVDAGFTALEAIVNDLLQFTSHRDPLWGRFDLKSLVEEVCDSMGLQLAAQNIDTDLDIPAGLAVFADRDMLRRALLNLILNALDVMPQGGELTITGLSTSHGVELEVADSGPGIPKSRELRLFEPFFTTKSGGTGLGLTIVERIAAAHGGEVNACNCPQGGAAFTIRIPFRSLEKAA